MEFGLLEIPNSDGKKFEQYCLHTNQPHQRQING